MPLPFQQDQSTWVFSLDVLKGQDSVFLVTVFVISGSLVFACRVAKSPSAGLPYPVRGKQTLLSVAHQTGVILGTRPPLCGCMNLDNYLSSLSLPISKIKI